MRFLCTCDCRKTTRDLEDVSRQVRGLRADYEDLYDRFVRLQGRWARTKRVEPPREDGEGAAAEPVPEDRDAKLNAEILARRRARVVS